LAGNGGSTAPPEHVQVSGIKNPPAPPQVPPQAAEIPPPRIYDGPSNPDFAPLAASQAAQIPPPQIVELSPDGAEIILIPRSTELAPSAPLPAPPAPPAEPTLPDALFPGFPAPSPGR